MKIDINFNFYSDTPKGKDPDSYSPTLRSYHKILWSKELTNGSLFKLDDSIPMRLHHKSELGEFVLSSDSIAHTYSKIKSTTDIIKKIDAEELEKFVSLCSTIGGYIIFPSQRINNQMTINGARGVNKQIRDRFDLSLECIRRYYKRENSPLNETFERYKQFFNLFDSFEGYVDFFLLQDLVTSDYSSIKYLIPFESFENYPLPNDIEEYKQYKYNLSNFVSARSQRIKSFNKWKNFKDGSEFMIDKAKKIIRKKAINNVNEKIAYLQKKPSDYTKDELRDLIVKEEKKILQGWGVKGAATTILAMFGIANF